MSMKKNIRDDTGKRHRYKYENSNFIHQLILGRFLDAVSSEIRAISSCRTLDFGCGEGLFLKELHKRGIRFKRLTGIDLREEALQEARLLLPEYHFIQTDLLTYKPEDGPFDLVIVSQVLEHLPEPGRFLKKLVQIGSGPFIITVPYEPWFRIVNLLRGRDILRLGNHPEHINFWGVNRLREFVEQYATITKIYTVFPFIIVLAEKPIE